MYWPEKYGLKRPVVPWAINGSVTWVMLNQWAIRTFDSDPPIQIGCPAYHLPYLGIISERLELTESDPDPFSMTCVIFGRQLAHVQCSGSLNRLAPYITTHEWHQPKRLPWVPSTCILGRQVLELYITYNDKPKGGMPFTSEPFVASPPPPPPIT